MCKPYKYANIFKNKIFLEVEGLSVTSSSVGFVTFDDPLYNCVLISILIHCRRLADYDWHVPSLMTIFMNFNLEERDFAASL